jgi:hypothetical protein
MAAVVKNFCFDNIDMNQQLNSSLKEQHLHFLFHAPSELMNQFATQSRNTTRAQNQHAVPSQTHRFRRYP